MSQLLIQTTNIFCSVFDLSLFPPHFKKVPPPMFSCMILWNYKHDLTGTHVVIIFRERAEVLETLRF